MYYKYLNKRLLFEIIKSYKNRLWYLIPTIRFMYVKSYEQYKLSIFLFNIEIELTLDLKDDER